MTSHNRREITLRCLAALAEQSGLEDVVMTTFLVDDGSTDGTPQAVARQFPRVRVLEGDGSLYWVGGMRKAMAVAIAEAFDLYLWLNDDTCLFPESIVRLTQTMSQLQRSDDRPVIVVGSTLDPRTGELSYGGFTRDVGPITKRLRRMAPSDHAIECETMNGNCVLIARSVVERLGNLDHRFTHSMADLDYGFRAKRAGCLVSLAPGYVGRCVQNSGDGLWQDLKVPTITRWKKLLGPKGLPPSEWLCFTKRHAGRFWPLIWLSPYVRFWVRAFIGRVQVVVRKVQGTSHGAAS
jgi:GT2 family glycosyltransferase